MGRIWRSGAALLLALGVAACGATQEDVEGLKQQQEEILQKLAALEKGQQKILAARPAAKPTRPPEDFAKVYDIDLGSAPVLGRSDAPVTIVEFSDFQCPFCARTEPLIAQVRKKYGDKVKIVYKQFPLNFHPAARPAAIASLAAQAQGKFWPFHNVLFEHNTKRDLDASKMVEYAKEAGLDVERFKKDLEKNKADFDKRVSEDYRQGVSVDVRGTPTLYINGRKVRSRSVEGMSAQIDQELKKAGS